MVQNVEVQCKPPSRRFFREVLGRGVPLKKYVKKLGGLCFQVLGSFGFLGVLGVFPFKTTVMESHGIL